MHRSGNVDARTNRIGVGHGDPDMPRLSEGPMPSTRYISFSLTSGAPVALRKGDVRSAGAQHEPEDPEHRQGCEQVLDGMATHDAAERVDPPVEHLVERHGECEPCQGDERLATVRVRRREQHQHERRHPERPIETRQIRPEVLGAAGLARQPVDQRAGQEQRECDTHDHACPTVNAFREERARESGDGERHRDAVPEERRVGRRVVVIGGTQPDQDGRREETRVERDLGPVSEARAEEPGALGPEPDERHQAHRHEREVRGDVGEVRDPQAGHVVSEDIVSGRIHAVREHRAERRRRRDPQYGEARPAREAAQPGAGRRKRWYLPGSSGALCFQFPSRAGQRLPLMSPTPTPTAATHHARLEGSEWVAKDRGRDKETAGSWARKHKRLGAHAPLRAHFVALRQREATVRRREATSYPSHPPHAPVASQPIARDVRSSGHASQLIAMERRATGSRSSSRVNCSAVCPIACVNVG